MRHMTYQNTPVFSSKYRFSFYIECKFNYLQGKLIICHYFIQVKNLTKKTSSYNKVKKKISLKKNLQNYVFFMYEMQILIKK